MTARLQTQSPAQTPPQPSYVLRGHDSQIHSVCFLRHNTRLLTGDAQGWVVLWDVASKRAVAVWRAHEGAILGLGSWADDKIITDTKLFVWQLRECDEQSFSSVLPIEDQSTKRPDPWLLHSLEINTLNFCSFAQCQAASASSAQGADSILISVPGRREGEIEIYCLPTQERVFTIEAPKGIKTGMVMALAITCLDDEICVTAGFESGHSCLWHKAAGASSWTNTHVDRAHTQPVLSLDLAKTQSSYFTSAADAIIASHPLSIVKTSENPNRQVQTKHSGQQALTVRSDEKIFATAGWDGRVRVYSVKTMRELAVLKWHREGCYALAFAETNVSAPGDVDPNLSDSHQTSAVSQLTVEQKRNIKVQTTHWLAAGAKDGKVSLWDIY